MGNDNWDSFDDYMAYKFATGDSGGPGGCCGSGCLGMLAIGILPVVGIVAIAVAIFT